MNDYDARKRAAGLTDSLVAPGRPRLRSLGVLARHPLEPGEGVSAMQPVYAGPGGRAHGPYPGSPAPGEALLGFAMDTVPAGPDERSVETISAAWALQSAFFTGLCGSPGSFAPVATLLTPQAGPYYQWLQAMPGSQVYASDAPPSFLPAPAYTTANDSWSQTSAVAASPAYDDLNARLILAAYKLGLGAKSHVDGLVMPLFDGGFTANGTDGAKFFAANHPGGVSNLGDTGGTLGYGIPGQFPGLLSTYQALVALGGPSDPVQGGRHCLLINQNYYTIALGYATSGTYPDNVVYSNQWLQDNFFQNKFTVATSEKLTNAHNYYYLVDGRAQVRPVVVKIVPTLTFDSPAASQASYSLSAGLTTSIGYGDFRACVAAGS